MSRTIVHLSDLHFSWVDEGLIEPLVRCVSELRPDVLTISGDFTQHAWPSEFESAAALLERLPGRKILVPGNHDMAFLNPVRRVTQRLRLFRKYITADLQPFYADGEIAILGLNTARVRNLRGGRIRDWQVRLLEERMAPVQPEVVRVLVTHHPFDLPDRFKAREIVGRGHTVIDRVVQRVDLLLAGHMHISHSGPTAERYKIEGASAVFVQAGTAISTRSRGESNAFQALHIDSETIDVRTFMWMDEKSTYAPSAVSNFRRSVNGWTRVAADNGSTAPI
jgi:3',5'-cyclic AMP phosphodiesterase CpdA